MPPNAAALSSLISQQQCQSIYTALDTGNSRLALQHCDAVLQNKTATTSHPLARSLRSLVLYRLHRIEEAVSEAEKVLSSPSPSLDGPVLTPLTFVLSRSGQKQKTADLLDSASKSRPNDQPLALKAFEALLAVPDYLKAQQLAMRMYKSFVIKSTTSSKRCLYFWWSMECYYLLATQTPQAQGAQLALTLAQRLIQRHIESDTGKFDQKSDEDLQVYISILAATNQEEKALQLLTTSPGSDIIKRSLALEQVYLKLLVKLQRWAELQEYTQGKITAGDRNWVTIEHWVQAVVQRGKADETVASSALSFIEPLAKSDGDKLRDFPLAKIALVHALRSEDITLTGTAASALPALIEEYFTAFQRKPSCYEDLLLYVDSLSAEEKTQLASSPTLCSLDVTRGTPNLDSEAAVVSSVNATKLSARLNGMPQETDKTISALLNAFYTSLPASSKQPKTVPRPGADFILMATHLSLQSKPTISHLTSLLTLLIHVSIASPASYSLKLLSLRLYLLLGNFTLARKTWDELKIRGIQNESLGWLWCSPCNPTPKLLSDSNTTSTPLTKWTHDAMELYKEGDVDTIRSSMTAFERGNYASIETFVEVKRRFEHSVQAALLRLMQCTEGKEEEVLRSVEDVVNAGVKEQWDTAVLESVYVGSGVKSLVQITSREDSEDEVGEWKDVQGFKNQTYLLRAMLQFASGVQVDSPPAKASQTTQLVSTYLTQPEATTLTSLLQHIEERLGSAATILPWQEQYLCSMVLRLHAALSQRSAPSERIAQVNDSLKRIAQLYSSRTLSSSSFEASQNALQQAMETQRGAAGVREKVIKDTREDIGRFAKRVVRVCGEVTQ